MVAGRRLRVLDRGHPAARGPSLRCRAWHPGRRQGTRTARRSNRHSTIHSGIDRPPGRHGSRAWSRPTGLGWSAPAARWRGVAIRPSRAGRVDRLVAGRPAPPSSGTESLHLAEPTRCQRARANIRTALAVASSDCSPTTSKPYLAWKASDRSFRGIVLTSAHRWVCPSAEEAKAR